ncbi:carbon-nitrogen hydrolase family protein [Kitasatospora atroaurantiaca]|uniref:Putative amidohydrolase n=1 Tax=Kitasatospora atroaurantiaca TaxID=285545 RepID=A0A561EY41_9ACTN|nr:carbon-nitrogen hydrolase family protein [Kitasatospora atroaurantiaca]TWE20531.1 putative amidohydrolase [Kitasatospora atroaurantiaca]
MTIPIHPLPASALTVAVAQATLAPLDIASNVATAAALVRRAADEGAELLLLSELFLTGYELHGIVADPDRLTVAPDDPRLVPLARACADTGTAVVVGAPVRDADTGSLHIAALVLDGTGRLAAVYRKQFATPGERAAGFSAGSAGCTVQLGDWRLGLGICWDSGFPEHARAAALDGAHAYLVGALFGTGSGAHQRRTLFPARALDNTVYTLLANHVGPSGPYVGCGRSAVWAPDGSLLAEADEAEPGLVTVRLDPVELARLRAAEPVLIQPGLSSAATPRTDTRLGRPRLGAAVRTP